MKLSALLLLMPLLQNTPAPAQQASSVQGTVIDAVSGLPIARATVQLRGHDGLLVRDTAADGTFSFPSVAPGRYTIEALKGGYIPNVYGGRQNELTPAFQELAPGQSLTGIQIALTPGGAIYGRLTDDRGEPVVAATVNALRTTYRAGQRVRTQFQATTTNDLGEYRLFLLPPGEYHVTTVATPAAASVSTAPFSRDFIPLYFPGTIDPEAASSIQLGVGEVRGGIDIPAIPTRSIRVAGSVDGTGGVAATVLLSPLNGTTSQRANADPESGAFEFTDVLPGSYALVATNRDRRAALPLDVRNADVLNVRIALLPGYRIPARVRIEGHGDGDDPELEKLYFLLRSDPPIPGLEDTTYSPFAHGGFILDVLFGGYRLDITRVEDYYVKTMTLGGVDVLNEGLRVTGPPDGRMEILVGMKLGSVEARAEQSGVTVVLVPDPARRGQRILYRSGAPDPSGRIRFEKVPPGDYKLFAFQEEDGGPWLESEYLRRYEEQGVPIRVEENAASRLDRPIPVAR